MENDKWKMENGSVGGLMILVLTPLGLGLIVLNCISWVLVRLHTGGLPVRKGLGWPWCYYTYEFARVGPSVWDFGALTLDVCVALAILIATAGLMLLYGRLRLNSSRRW